jgi:hypothetical protein
MAAVKKLHSVFVILREIRHLVGILNEVFQTYFEDILQLEINLFIKC